MRLFSVVRVNRLADGWAFVKGEFVRVARATLVSAVVRSFLFASLSHHYRVYQMRNRF